jgi:hypothetical protein
MCGEEWHFKAGLGGRLRPMKGAESWTVGEAEA